MDISYTVEQCVHELILYFLRNSYPLETVDIQFNNCTNIIGQALLNIASAFKKEFEYLIDQRFLEFRSPREFPGEVLPICLKIAEDPKALRTLVGCAFLLEVVKFIHVNHKCYKFTDAADKSLVFYINRKWNLVFDQPETSEYFITYCEMVNARFSSAGEGIENIDILCSNVHPKESILRNVQDCYEYYEKLHVTREEYDRFFLAGIRDQDDENPEETFRRCTLCRRNCESLVNSILRQLTANKSKWGEDLYLLLSELNNIPVTES